MPQEPQGQSFADRAVETLRGMEAARGEVEWYSADFISRVAARLIDGLIIGALGTAILLTIFILQEEGEREPAPPPGAVEEESLLTLAPAMPGPGTIAFIVVASALLVLYETLPGGATPGRRTMGLRLVRTGTGDQANAALIGIRTLLWAVPFVVGCLSVGLSILYPLVAFGLLGVMAAWHRRDPRGRPLWDILAGTESLRRA